MGICIHYIHKISVVYFTELVLSGLENMLRNLNSPFNGLDPNTGHTICGNIIFALKFKKSWIFEGVL